jgi:mono/diheme cytochrome c family protein
MRANKILLLGSSVGVLLLLAGTALQENVLQSWRKVQRAYETRRPADPDNGFGVQLRQVVVPDLGVADRCVSCHLGMAPGEEGIAGDALYGPHPDIPHGPAEFGCVACHGGQGRATSVPDAHGDVRHWPHPLLPKPFFHAGCGSCHTHLAVPNLDRLERGQSLLERYDCLACHSVDGRGGTLRPGAEEGFQGTDLSRTGAAGWRPGWYEDHLERHRRAEEGPWRRSFGAVPDGDREAIEAYLSALVGAPGLVRAKARFHSLGCRGCHRVGGVGGDDGPDLTRAGDLDPGRLDFSHVPGKPTIAAWTAEHLRVPGRIVPDSQMPYLGLSDEEIRELTFYVLSLRRSETPSAYWPKDRIRAERFGEREFATDGPTLYGSFCAACHGPAGQGMRYPRMSSFPAVGNPDFLAVASDGFIAETVRQGRPGRRMPAWSETEGGLRPGEIDNVVAAVRALGGGVPSPAEDRPARWARGRSDVGSALYGKTCSGCHGKDGEGLEGPSLSNPVLLRTATDTYLMETACNGRRDTPMKGFASPSLDQPTLSEEEIEDIVTFIRTWEKRP